MPYKKQLKSFWDKTKIWQKVLMAAVLIFAVLTVLDFAGYVNSGIKSWMFEHAYKERMRKIEELEKQNDRLREEMQAYEQKALELKAKDAILEERLKNLDAKTREELDKLDRALEEQAKEEAITEIPVDNKTRCERLKSKLQALKIKGAEDIKCDEY